MIYQIEHFGVRFQSDGATTYGLRVDGVMDNVRDHVGVDALARLLWDIHADSAPLVRIRGGGRFWVRGTIVFWVWYLLSPTRPSPVGHPC